MSERSEATAFGRLLRRHRARRNLTQERLAYRAGLSPRHMSFLETGRSNPSRSSALAVARALDLPLADRNALLRAAGFAAAYPERDPLVSGDGHVRSLFAFLLRRHEPFPAFVVDLAWTVRMHNGAAERMMAWLLEDLSARPADRRPSAPVGGPRQAVGASAASDGSATGGALEGANLLDVLFDPEALRPLTVNFGEVGRYLWDRLEDEIALRPRDEELTGLRERLRGYGPVPDVDPGAPARDDVPALPVHLRKDGADLRLFSFLMTVAAPLEVGLQRLRLETFPPADEASAALLRRIADAGS